MSSTLPKPALDAPRKMLRMRGPEGETALKNLEQRGADANKRLGKVIGRALDYAAQTRKATSDAMGYDDPNGANVSRWIAGTENAQFARLWATTDAMRDALIVALAEDAKSATVEVCTVVSVRRPA